MYYDDDDDIEKMLRLDSMDKKKTGRGVFNRASRRGYIRGGLKTQSDFMSSKEKKKLNSEVRTSNMYEKYKELSNCDYSEIMSHEKSEIKNILTFMKATHSSMKIAKQFGVSSGKLYNDYDKFGVEYNKGRNASNSAYKRPLKEAKLIEVKKFKLMDVVERGQYLAPFVKEFSVLEMAKHFEITKQMLYYYINKARKAGKLVDEEKMKTVQQVIEEQITMDRETMKEDVKEMEVVKVDNSELENKMKELELQLAELHSKLKEEKSNGLKVELNGVYSKEELENRLLSVASITADDKSYKVNIFLEEV